MKKLQRFVIPSLMLISMYTASQTIGETEASYSSQSAKTVRISAAFVFPSTIETLEKESADRAEDIQKLTNANPHTLSLRDLLVLKKEAHTKIQFLQNIQTELHHYKSKAAANPKEYRYVMNGSEQVDKLINQLNAASLLNQIDQHIASSEKKQQEHQKKKTKETPPPPVEDEEKKEPAEKDEADTTANDKSTTQPTRSETQTDTGGNES